MRISDKDGLSLCLQEEAIKEGDAAADEYVEGDDDEEEDEEEEVEYVNEEDLGFDAVMLHSFFVLDN